MQESKIIIDSISNLDNLPEEVKLAILKAQVELALSKKNVNMLIHLGKCYLNQGDKPSDINPLDEMSAEELKAAILEAASKVNNEKE